MKEVKKHSTRQVGRRWAARWRRPMARRRTARVGLAERSHSKAEDAGLAEWETKTQSWL